MLRNVSVEEVVEFAAACERQLLALLRLRDVIWPCPLRRAKAVVRPILPDDRIWTHSGHQLLSVNFSAQGSRELLSFAE